MNNYSVFKASDVPKLYGKHCCLVAPSQSGKTTLCRSIAQMADKKYEELTWNTRNWTPNTVYEFQEKGSFASEFSVIPDDCIVVRTQNDLPKEKEIVKYNMEYIILGWNCPTETIEKTYNMLAPVLPVKSAAQLINIVYRSSFQFTLIDITTPVRNGDKECEIFRFVPETKVAAQHSLLFANLKKKVATEQIDSDISFALKNELNIKEFKAEKADLLGKVLCCVGWSKTGKTVAIQSLAFECDTWYLGSCSIDSAMKPSFIETSGLNEHDIRQANGKHCIVESCSSFTCTKPDMRQFVEYIIICGKMPKRELDRIYEFYEHIFPVGKQILYELVETINVNYRCTVIDISYPVRQGLKKGQVYWYEDKHLVSVSNEAKQKNIE